VGMVELVRNTMQDGGAQLRRLRDAAEGQLYRARGGSCYGQRETAIGSDTADQECCGSPDRRQRNLAKRRTPLQCSQREIDLPQEIAGQEHVTLVAGDEVGDGDFALAAAGLPD